MAVLRGIERIIAREVALWTCARMHLLATDGIVEWWDCRSLVWGEVEPRV